MLLTVCNDEVKFYGAEKIKDADIVGECYTKKKGQVDGRMQYMELAQDIIKEVKRVVIGKDECIWKALAAILAG